MTARLYRLPSGDGSFQVSTAPDSAALSKVYNWLNENAFWHGGRSEDEFRQQVSHGAIVFVLTQESSDEPLGFARVAGDSIRLAYISDLFVAESLRGKGLGNLFAEHVFNQGQRWKWRWLLHAEAETAKWYERRFGFTIVGKSPISSKIGKDIKLLERLPLDGEPVSA